MSASTEPRALEHSPSMAPSAQHGAWHTADPSQWWVEGGTDHAQSRLWVVIWSHLSLTPHTGNPSSAS